MIVLILTCASVFAEEETHPAPLELHTGDKFTLTLSDLTILDGTLSWNMALNPSGDAICSWTMQDGTWLSAPDEQACDSVSLRVQYQNVPIADAAQPIKLSFLFPSNFSKIRFISPSDEGVEAEWETKFSFPIAYAFFGEKGLNLTITEHEQRFRTIGTIYTKTELTTEVKDVKAGFRRVEFTTLTGTNYLNSMLSPYPVEGEPGSIAAFYNDELFALGGGAGPATTLDANGKAVEVPLAENPMSYAETSNIYDTDQVGQKMVPTAFIREWSAPIVRLEYIDADGARKIWEDAFDADWRIIFDLKE